MLKNKKRKSLFVHAIKNNPDGSVTKRVFGRVTWDNLAPIVRYDPMGGTKEFPKQGYEEVPEGWGAEAPAPLKSSSRRKSKEKDEESSEQSEDSPE